MTFSFSFSSYLKVPINRGVRKLKGRRRRRKHHLKSESGSFHTSPFLTSSHSIRQLLAFVDLISKRLYVSLEEDKENFCYVFTSFKTREISKFQVVNRTTTANKGTKSVMHMQSCYFANLNLLLPCRLVALPLYSTTATPIETSQRTDFVTFQSFSRFINSKSLPASWG